MTGQHTKKQSREIQLARRRAAAAEQRALLQRLTRVRIIAAVVAVMRDAETPCMDACAAGARAFPQLPGIVIAKLHHDDLIDRFCGEQGTFALVKSPEQNPRSCFLRSKR
jgi:hypothetical protein